MEYFFFFVKRKDGTGPLLASFLFFQKIALIGAGVAFFRFIPVTKIG